jgi:predicted acyltransferase
MRAALDDSLSAAAHKSASRRIASLDWARGIMLVASVVSNSLIAPPKWFEHARWSGIHPVDVIFPMFVTLSGCGLAFAMHRRVKVGPLARRFVVLMVVGLAYNAILAWSVDVATWRVTGVLQLYAVLVVLMGLLHLVTRSWRGWAVLTVILAVAHTLVLGLYARSCPSGVLTRECNPSGPLDSLLFGANHIYALGQAGHDPEGLVAILGALVSAAAGATVGHLLLSLTGGGETRPRLRSVAALCAAAAGFLLLIVALRVPAVALGFELTFVKRVWTAPFALLIAALTTMLLLAGHLLLDREPTLRGVERVSFPLLALGRNSLLVYFGSHILMSLLRRPVGEAPSIVERYSAAVASPVVAQVVWSGTLLVFWIGLATLFHRRGIYLRP